MNDNRLWASTSVRMTFTFLPCLRAAFRATRMSASRFGRARGPETVATPRRTPNTDRMHTKKLRTCYTPYISNFPRRLQRGPYILVKCCSANKREDRSQSTSGPLSGPFGTVDMATHAFHFGDLHPIHFSFDGTRRT